MAAPPDRDRPASAGAGDRKSTRLNSSHQIISYAVFCLKKKKKELRNSEDRDSRLIRHIDAQNTSMHREVGLEKTQERYLQSVMCNMPPYGAQIRALMHA